MRGSCKPWTRCARLVYQSEGFNAQRSTSNLNLKEYKRSGMIIRRQTNTGVTWPASSSESGMIDHRRGESSSTPRSQASSFIPQALEKGRNLSVLSRKQDLISSFTKSWCVPILRSTNSENTWCSVSHYSQKESIIQDLTILVSHAIVDVNIVGMSTTSEELKQIYGLFWRVRFHLSLCQESLSISWQYAGNCAFSCLFLCPLLFRAKTISSSFEEFPGPGFGSVNNLVLWVLWCYQTRCIASSHHKTAPTIWWIQCCHFSINLLLKSVLSRTVGPVVRIGPNEVRDYMDTTGGPHEH